MNCDNKCSTCSTKCNLLCPICNKQVKNVPIQTVKSLIKHDINLLETEETYICLNKKCNLVYFQNNNPSYYFKNDVNKPVWFKEKYPNYIVCYCRNIYLKEIVELIQSINQDNLTKEEIIKLLKKEKAEENCLNNNPLGESCDKLFKNAIEFAYNQKKRV